MKESRLIGLTLEEVNKQRVAAGATATNTVYNSRTAEANAASSSQPTRSTGTAVTDPAAASLQRLRETQAYLAENPAVDPTGSIGAQALAGQKLAESYVAPTNPGNTEYYKQQAAQLQGATSTYTNAANGYQSQVNNYIDTNKDSPTYGQQLQGPVQMASQSGLEQAAIDNLRKNGKTDAEITSIMASPEFKNSIMTAMSNTGTGTGTARTSPVLTVAEAQHILATSRNPNQRKEAQSFIDSQVGGVKGYAARTTTNDQGTFTTYSEDAGATVEAQRKERERLALEQANRLKSQEAAEKLKKFVAGVDTTAIDKTKTQIETLMSSIAGLSPDLQAAVLPQLLAIQQTNNDIAFQANEITNALPTDKEIEGSYGTMENYIISQDAKFKDILAKNLETSKEIAQYNQDALKIEKQIIDHDAAVAEQKQMVANAEGEKMLRRQLNRLGIQTDTSGLSYLQSEIQKGVTALDNLKTANNLVSLKAQLAIGEGYRLEVKQAMETYEANYLNLTSQTTEKLQTIKNSISTAKADRNKSIIETKKWELEQKINLDKEARTTISAAYKDMINQQNTLRDDNRAQEALGWSVLDKAIDDYGTNIPKSILDRVGKMLPGVDLQDVAKAKTLAQLKKAGGGGGGSIGLVFSPQSMGPDGSAPSYETFVREKKEALKNNTTLSIEDAQKALDPKKLKEEYQASINALKQGNASTIVENFERRATAKGMTGPTYTRAANLVKGYLDQGRNDLAQGIVDSIGDDVSDTANTSFVNALGTRSQLISLHEAVQGLKARGPLTGKLNNLNLNDPAIKRVQFFITSTVPGMARGIFNEVGVLTDDDVARYTRIMENPDLTIEQAINTYNDLTGIVNARMQNQISSWEANGKRTAGYRQLFNENMANNPSEPAQNSMSDDEVANSILQ